LERFARSTFGRLKPAYDRVNGICNRIHDYVFYKGGISDALTSTFDTVTQRAGVCRDFAHLAIALCRSLGIPARYVSAYAFRHDPPDFHAVFKAYLAGPNDGGWYLFDAARMADPAGLMRIGLGRDAADLDLCSPFGAWKPESRRCGWRQKDLPKPPPPRPSEPATAQNARQPPRFTSKQP